MQAKSKMRRTVSNRMSLFQPYPQDTEKYVRTAHVYAQMRFIRNVNLRGSTCFVVT
jgi:hypothetical protein